jgi:hypothetical protein
MMKKNTSFRIIEQDSHYVNGKAYTIFIKYEK